MITDTAVSKDTGRMNSLTSKMIMIKKVVVGKNSKILSSLHLKNNLLVLIYY